ncbi:MAG: alpha amylase C-terminal domain-containing protein, partial [Candidatus Limnocylindrales bacterium]
IRAVDGDGGGALPDGWSFMAWVNDEIHERMPWKLTIAEDIQNDQSLVTPSAEGGAGFDAQWDAAFLRQVRPALEAGDDADRDIDAVVAAILGKGRGPAMTRVIYTESHDDVANDFVRVPEAIAPGDGGSWWSKKRANLGSGLVLTAPGIPMLFQGQELLEDRWFDDTAALDWSKASTHEGLLRLHRDLIALRRATDGSTRGLRGPNVAILRADRDSKVIAFHRWSVGGPGDDVVVIANLADRFVADLRVGFPAPGRWRVRFNSDSAGYALDFGGHEAFDTDADGEPLDGQEQSALVAVGPYSLVILSRED